MLESNTALDNLLAEGVDQGVFPGATCGVFGIETGEPFVHFGRAGAIGGPANSAVDLRTTYDLASLTKMFFACMVLRSRDQFALDAVPVPRSDSISIEPSWTVRALLSHRSGLQAWAPLFSECPHIPGSNEARAWLVAQASHRLRADVSDEKTEYSDLGYIVLGDCVSHMLGKPLQVCLRDRVLAPLGIDDAVNFASSLPNAAFAPTEFDAWRARAICGEVHDENCAALGGVSAHAGLFGDIRGVARFAQTLLNVTLNESTFVDAGVLRTCLVPSKGSSYGTGFDTKRGGQRAFGNKLSDSTFGHLGFTGTSIAIDPRRMLGVVLLSNRVHPTRENIRIREYRPHFHDKIVEMFSRRK